MEKILFKEEQRFRQWWLWLILISTLLAIVIPIAKELSAQSWETSSEDFSRLILYGSVAVLFIVAVLIVLVLSRLKTKILIILAIEIIVAILISGIIQVLK